MILTFYKMKMQGYFDVYKWTFLRRTSLEGSMFTSDVINVRNVYTEHKQRDLSQILTRRHFLCVQRENVNVMLEFEVEPRQKYKKKS